MRKILKITWWNIRVIFSKLIYDPLMLDWFDVLPPNEFTWELSRKEYNKRFRITK